MLDEKAMCERFLKSNVFVSPSSIENESNSVSEAMLMGVPTISSFVGGVTNRLIHNKEGYMYQHDSPYMLAYYICETFANDEQTKLFSENAKAHASNTNNKNNNLETMLNIYKKIGKVD